MVELVALFAAAAREQRCIATGHWKVRGNVAAARMSRSALGSAR